MIGLVDLTLRNGAWIRENELEIYVDLKSV